MDGVPFCPIFLSKHFEVDCKGNFLFDGFGGCLFPFFIFSTINLPHKLFHYLSTGVFKCSFTEEKRYLF
jgi:hypothetical protein